MNNKIRDKNKVDMKPESTKLHISYLSIILLFLCALVYYILQESGSGTTSHNVMAVIQNFLIPVIISIVCSVIASIICAVFSKIETENSISRITKNVTEIYSGISEMMPSRYYRSSDAPNLDFNQYLNRKILGSRKYRFYGESARYTCKRLLALPENDVKNLEVELFIVDPTAEDSIHDSIAYLRDKDRNRNSYRQANTKISDEDLIKNEKIKTLACLYKLGEMQGKFKELRIYLLKHVPTMTIEMTDDTTVLEFFRTRENHSHYPLTLIYDNKPTIYECYDFIIDWEKHNLSEMTYESLKIHELVNLGKRAKMEKIDQQTIIDYAKKRIENDSNM